ncbi:MAG: type II toxin-antitoxin system VapC family toxin [Chitinophagales bacterium]|nr:type II toxin-antitoxin system VapC family toxin [Chitinophagales bacterium]
MSYLLDTHTLIWAIFDDQKLSQQIRSILSDSSNNIYVSHVTFWEISLKHSIGKIELKGTTPDELPYWCKRLNFDVFPISENDVCRSYVLPPSLHKDPFDRLLAWQAINRNYSLLSKDSLLKVYIPWKLTVIW